MRVETVAVVYAAPLPSARPATEATGVVNSLAGDGLNMVPTSDAAVSMSIHIKMILPLRAVSTNQTAKSTCLRLRLASGCPAAPSEMQSPPPSPNTSAAIETKI